MAAVIVLSTVVEIVDPVRRDALRVEANLSTEQLEGLARGTWRPKSPVVCKRFQGTKLYDFLWAGDVEMCLLSQRVARILADNRVTGWTSYPVKVVGARGVEIPGYVGFSVTGKCGPIDDSLSERVEVRTPSGARATELVGLRFDPSSWDGADVFTPRGTTARFATGRVEELIRTQKLTNVAIERIAEERRLVY